MKRSRDRATYKTTPHHTQDPADQSFRPDPARETSVEIIMLHSALVACTAKSKTRNRFPGTNGTEIAVSCTGFRDVPGTEIRAEPGS
eukprot:1397953-Rhodomonas_salina.1